MVKETNTYNEYYERGFLAGRNMRDRKLMMGDKSYASKFADARKKYSERVNSKVILRIQEEIKYTRLNRQIKTNQRKEKIVSNFIFSAVVAVFLFAGVEARDFFNTEISQPEQKTTTIKNKLRGAGIIAIYGLIGILMGGVWSSRTKKEWSIKNADEFYNRLVVRYFDKLHSEKPEITEDAIKTFNPDLARVVCGLLTANLSKQDIAKLDNLALTMASDLGNGNIDANLIDIEEKMAKAIKIVDKALSKDPRLQQAIIDAYMGKLPYSTFTVAGHFKMSELQL